MFEDRIVIPPSLRDKVCHILHSAHQGTTHMSERARATLFWPGMSKHITEMRERCTTCWKLSPTQTFQPLLIQQYHLPLLRLSPQITVLLVDTTASLPLTDSAIGRSSWPH